MLSLLAMLLLGPNLHVLGPWHFGDFCNIFLPNIGEDQKTSHHLSAGPLAGIVPCYDKSDPGYCITLIKRLDEGLR